MQTEPTYNSTGSLKSDMDAFETLYNSLINSTSLIYGKKVNIAMAGILTIVILSLTLSEKHEWYSYVLCAMSILCIWYIFFLTDRIRKSRQDIQREESEITRMRLRKDVIDRLSDLRIKTTVQMVLGFLTIISLRPLQKLLDYPIVIIIGFIIVISAASLLYYQNRVRTAKQYLDMIIAKLERGN